MKTIKIKNGNRIAISVGDVNEVGTVEEVITDSSNAFWTIRFRDPIGYIVLDTDMFKDVISATKEEGDEMV